MPKSRFSKEYGINSTELNKLCWEQQIFPIYNFERYFIDDYGNIYTLEKDKDDEYDFVELTPIRYNNPHHVPVYEMKSDFDEWITSPADKIYMENYYGLLPNAEIVYPSLDAKFSDCAQRLWYRVYDIRYENGIYYLNGMSFKRFDTDLYSNSKSSELYFSSVGTAYDGRRKVFYKRGYNKKMYHTVKGLAISRLIYITWKNNGEKLPKDIQVDHADGYKTHNWIDNLVAINAVDNFRKAFFEQNLRDTIWNPLILRRLCELIEQGTMGPAEMRKILMNDFPGFEPTYDSVKRKTYELQYKGSWPEITKDYNFSNYKKNESLHPNTATADDIIHAVCKAYMSHKYQYNKEIAQELGISETIVNKVLRKEIRTDISSQYDIDYEFEPRNRSKLTEEEIVGICQDIVNGMKYRDIAIKWGRNRGMFKRLVTRELYPEITSKFYFEERFPNYNYKIPYNNA